MHAHLKGIIGLSAIIAVGACGDQSASEQSDDVIRLGIASFNMETCTFCPNPTGVKEFEHYGPPFEGADVLRYAPGGTRGFLLAASEYEGVEVSGVYSVRSPFGGSSGGTVTCEAFNKYADEIARRFGEAKDIDGIYLPLHGAMAVDCVAKPEAELVRRIRSQVGPDVPIAVTMDLHGNEDHELSDVADFVMATKRYPHYDHNLNGERSARLLIRAIRGSYTPTMAARKPGVTFATVFGGTHDGAPQDVMERARRWENQYLDVFVSVFWGFTFADAADGGAAVFVITNNDQQLADRIAEDMASYIWDRREDFEKRLPDASEGVEQGLQALAEGRGPVILANQSDRMGDATHILRELMKRNASNYAMATIGDAEALELIRSQHQIGDLVRVTVGGTSSQLAGAPIEIEGIVHYLGELGRSGIESDPVAVLRFGPDQSNYLFITPTLYQVTTREIFDATNVPVEELDIIAIKSRVHFYRGFMETRMVNTAIVIDAPGHGPADIGTVEYKNLPQGTWSKFFDNEPRQ